MSDMNNIYRKKKNHNEYGSGGYSTNDKLRIGGDILTGGLSGVAAGASLGIPGMIIGGVAGVTTSAINSNNVIKQENELQDRYNAEENTRLDNKAYNESIGFGENGMYAMGGPLEQGAMGSEESLNSFNGGGTHEENPLGGIPIGNGNTVEEGETKYNPEDYIFSDRILINKNIQEEYNLPKSVIGKSFAEYSKKVDKKYSYRKGDKIDNETKDRELKLLIDAQESFKRVEMPQQSPQQSVQEQQLMGQQMDVNNPMMQGKQFGKGGPVTTTNRDSRGRVTGTSTTVDYNPSQNRLIVVDGEVVENPNWVNNVPQDNSTASTKSYSTEPVTGTTPPPLLTNMEKVGAFAPMAYNLVQGLAPAKKLNSKDYEIKANKAIASKLNINDVLRSNNETYNTQQQAIKSASGGNGASYLANIAQAQVLKNKADSNAIIKKENIDNANRDRVQQLNISNQLNVDNINSGKRFAVDDINMQSVAQKNHHLGATALQSQQISNLYAQQRFNKATSDELISAGYAKNAQEAFLIMSNPELMKKIKGK